MSKKKIDDPILLQDEITGELYRFCEIPNMNPEHNHIILESQPNGHKCLIDLFCKSNMKYVPYEQARKELKKRGWLK